MDLADIGSVRTISFTELLSVGFASLNGEAIQVCFSGRYQEEYEIVVDQLSRHGYHSIGAKEAFSNGRISSDVFVQETMFRFENRLLKTR